MLPQGGTVLCALSGGRDSVALLHFLMGLAKEQGFRVEAAHYDHRLRPTAQRDEDFVRELCQRLGVSLTVGSGDVAAYSREQGLSLEEAARTLRYRFLEETAHRIGAERIATAHHSGDNAETVLMDLLRGTGLHGLTGIPPVRGRIIRPFLDTDRREIDAYIQENGLPYVEDETNYQTFCTRNRLRLQVFPLLEEISPGCTGRIAAAAGRLLEDDLHLTRETEALLPPITEGQIALPAKLLRSQDKALALRLVLSAAEKLGGDLDARQAQAVLALGTGSALDLPLGLQAVRRRETVLLRKKPVLPPMQALHMGEQTWGGYTVLVDRYAGEMPLGDNIVVIKYTEEPLSIGPCRGGDRLGVGNGRRTVKRLLMDRGVPAEYRESCPGLYCGGSLAAVFGAAVEHSRIPQAGEPALKIRLVKHSQTGPVGYYIEKDPKIR